MYSIIHHKSNGRSITAAFVLTVGLSMGCSSCSKCETCTKDSSDTIRVCEKDYNSNTEYGLKLDFYQATGYKCKSSP